MKNKQLLFPTDFSENSTAALREALHLNQILKYEITLFHSFSRPYSKKAKSKNQLKFELQHQEELVDHKFHNLIEEVPELKDHSFRIKKKVGYSVDMILEQLTEEPSDLIVMSTKGAVGLGVIWGTRTAKIIKSVDIPVLVVPVDTKLSNIKRLGLACDFSENTEYDKLDFLITLAEKGDHNINIVTLNRYERSMTRHELTNRANLLKTLSDIPSKVSCTYHNDVDIGLIEYCKSHEIGLIAVLPKSYNFIERAFHDSLTLRMAFHSPIPLLVLK